MQTSATRGAAISFMQIFWVVGCLILTALPFHWTTLSAMAGVLPLVLGLLVWKLPESARFLFSKGKTEEALESLRIMFAMNTKKDKEQFPVQALLADESLEEVSARVAGDKLVPGYLRPKRFCIPVLLFARFVFVFGFHSLSQRAAGLLPRHETVFPLRHDSSNCDLGRHPTRAPQHALMTLADPPASRLACDPGGHPRNLHLAMLLLGGATVPAAVCLAFNADRLGRKFFLVVSHLVSGYVMFLWFLSQDPATAMVLAAGYQATCSVAAASSQCFAVELASSKVRATCVACLLFAERLGFVMADLGFLFGLDVSCVGFDIFMAILVTLSGGMILSLPDTSGIPLR
ncbi:uncharacterized protein LOC134533550 [Bacillus rossius redtenbacheri]|uniref:uncharacterized protein LOC134533550 n=1 Tax=Bacillus rossius redtenbacheri TaxID=93214 RepID=UPI002FDEB535